MTEPVVQNLQIINEKGLHARASAKLVEVVEEECVNSVFYRSSVEAALRFKYKPRAVNGEPIEVRGVLNMFHYVNKEAQ